MTAVVKMLRIAYPYTGANRQSARELLTYLQTHFRPVDIGLAYKIKTKRALADDYHIIDCKHVRTDVGAYTIFTVATGSGEDCNYDSAGVLDVVQNIAKLATNAILNEQFGLANLHNGEGSDPDKKDEEPKGLHMKAGLKTGMKLLKSVMQERAPRKFRKNMTIVSRRKRVYHVRAGDKFYIAKLKLTPVRVVTLTHPSTTIRVSPAQANAMLANSFTVKPAEPDVTAPATSDAHVQSA